MLLRTKLITATIATTTAVVGGLSCLNFDGAILENAVGESKIANTAAIEAIRQAKDTIENENKKIAGLSGAITTLDNKIDGLEKKIEAAKISGAADKGTIEDLESQLEAANQAKQDLQSELEAANQAKQDAEDKAKEANKKAEEAQAKLEEAQKKVDEAKAEGNVDSSELERLEKELEEAQEEADAAAIEATDKAKGYYEAYRYEYKEVAEANEFVQTQAKKITDATNSLEKEITSLNDLMNSDKTKNALNTPINNGQTTK